MGCFLCRLNSNQIDIGNATRGGIENWISMKGAREICAHFSTDAFMIFRFLQFLCK